MQWYIRLQPHGQTRDRKMIVKHPYLPAVKISSILCIIEDGFTVTKNNQLKYIIFVMYKTNPH